MFTVKGSLLRLSAAVGLVLAGVSAGCGGSSNGPNTTNVTLMGDYGGTSTGTSRTPATLQLTASGGQLILPCDNGDRFNQPLVTDGSGHFSVTGTEYSGFPIGVPVGVPAPVPRTVVLSGTANGDTLTMTLTDTATQQTVDTYTVVKGKNAPPSNGGCPG